MTLNSSFVNQRSVVDKRCMRDSTLFPGIFEVIFGRDTEDCSWSWFIPNDEGDQRNHGTTSFFVDWKECSMYKIAMNLSMWLTGR